MLDAHQHFWEIARGDHDWVSPDYPALFGDFGPEELAPLMQANGIAGTVLIQAAETEDETDYLLGIANRTDFILGVVGWLDMYAETFSDRLDHYRGQPKWVGLRPMFFNASRVKPEIGSGTALWLARIRGCPATWSSPPWWPASPAWAWTCASWARCRRRAWP